MTVNEAKEILLSTKFNVSYGVIFKAYYRETYKNVT